MRAVIALQAMLLLLFYLNTQASELGDIEYITEDCEEEECGAELADVTGDAQINVLDLVQIANLILEVSTPAYPCAADFSGDGEVNILDLVQISNYILNPNSTS